jgi:hypothetical protein
MSSTGTLASYALDLQLPERLVAAAQLQMIREAQASGQPLTLTVDSKQQRIVAVQAGDAGSIVRPGEEEPVDGFVEAVALAPPLAPMGNLALVDFTTAPPFSGSGNVVELQPFTPELRRFLVVQGSLEYELFLAGLRDKLRMRALSGPELGGRGGDNPNQPPPPPPVGVAPLQPREGGDPAAPPPAEPPKTTLVRSAQLLAPLASASRPVWIQISRHSLDCGPDGPACTEGLPSNDLTPQGLRDLRIPYTAEWVGCGCFNHGVYRLQFDLDVDFEVFVDGKPLCVHASKDGKTRFAHACLDGEHCIRVVLCGWTCRAVFRMDVYRIR